MNQIHCMNRHHIFLHFYIFYSIQLQLIFQKVTLEKMSKKAPQIATARKMCHSAATRGGPARSCVRILAPTKTVKGPPKTTILRTRGSFFQNFFYGKFFVRIYLFFAAVLAPNEQL